jgi:hypothetical protein
VRSVQCSLVLLIDQLAVCPLNLLFRTSLIIVCNTDSALHEQAVDDYVRSGMVVGLGTGSTAYFAVERVGEKVCHSCLYVIRREEEDI